jgi:hypothetical protein
VFDSDSKMSYIGGVLVGFDSSQTNGVGTMASPYVTTQTVLRLPAGQTIRYMYKAGVLRIQEDQTVIRRRRHDAGVMWKPMNRSRAAEG